MLIVSKFLELWNQCVDATGQGPNKRRHTTNKNAVEESTGVGHNHDEEETSNGSGVDALCGEMNGRFGECNSILMDLLSSLDLAGHMFLDTAKVKSLLEYVVAEYAVAQQFLHTQVNGSTPAEDWKWTQNSSDHLPQDHGGISKCQGSDEVCFKVWNLHCHV